MRVLLCLIPAALLAMVIGAGTADEQVAQGPAEKVEKKIREKAADKGAPKPAEKPAAKPAENPAARPAEKPAEKPAAKTPVVRPAAAESRAADEQTIRGHAETFMKTHARQDAKALAAMFTADGEYVDDGGNVVQGRSAIEQTLAGAFAELPGRKLELAIDSIRFLGPGVAVEDGKSTLTNPAGGPPERMHYTALHVKQDGQWLIASVREVEPSPRGRQREELAALEFLVGDWVDERHDAVVNFSCRPVDNGNFLLREFTVKIGGRVMVSGSQRIGWDAKAGCLRAWTFDSDGGFGEGVWHRNGESWVLRSSGVTDEGRTVSTSGVFTPVNKHTMTWQAVEIIVDGVRQPDAEVVSLVKRPPAPQ